MGGFCYESSRVQVRNNLFFLPNQELPFSGENLCVYSKNGQHQSQGEILNGKQEGWWTWWKENGEVWKKEQYDDGEKIGYKRISFNKNGQIEREAIYQNQNYIGENKYLFYESGQILGKYTKDTASNENMTVWYESGQIRAEGSYQNSKPSGKYINWFENGQIKETGSYKEGELDGKLTSWDENGQIRGEGVFKNGIKDGVWTYWYENGQIYKEEDLKALVQEALKEKARKVLAEIKRKVEEAKIIASLTKEEKDNLSSLRSAYVNNIAARVRTFWRYQGAEDNWNCDVYVQQDENGNVESVYVQQCDTSGSNASMSDEKARVFRSSIERAVYKSSPLPAAPDDNVFAREISFKFSVN